jgi:hypothetical protein
MTDIPLAVAVLVPTTRKVGKGVVEAPWRVIYANGDIMEARKAAEAWSARNQGQSAILVNYVDHVSAVIKTEWAKP